MEVQMRNGLARWAVVLHNRRAARVKRPLDSDGRQTNHPEHCTAIRFGQRVQVLNMAVRHDQRIARSRRLISTDEHSEPFIIESPRRAAGPPPQLITEVAARLVCL